MSKNVHFYKEELIHSDNLQVVQASLHSSSLNKNSLRNFLLKMLIIGVIALLVNLLNYYFNNNTLKNTTTIINIIAPCSSIFVVIAFLIERMLTPKKEIDQIRMSHTFSSNESDSSIEFDSSIEDREFGGGRPIPELDNECFLRLKTEH